jgi:6-phosphogluconolactonase (cycloisomerase 2 family)
MISGLAGSGLVLRNNDGDALTITTNGATAFATRLRNSSAYSVTIASQPLTPSQTCIVANAAGTIAGGDVAGIAVTCTTNQFPVGGTISGLSGSVVLQNNGGDDLSLAANGAFTFNTAVSSGAAYNVTILTQPDSPPQRCFVDSSAVGTVGNGTVTTAAIECQTQYPRLAYALNSGDGSISVYNVDTATGQLRSRGSVKTGTQPVDGITTDDGRYSYFLNAGSASVSAYTRDGVTGELREISGSPFATGAVAGTSGSITLHPNGRFIYVANGTGGNSIAAFAIDSAGALTAISGSPFAAGTVPYSVTVHSSGRFAYVVNASSKDIYTYSIDASTGTLTEVAQSRIATGADPRRLNLHPNGRFAYVPNTGESSVTAYSVDQATGVLTAIPGGVVTTGNSPEGKVLFHPTGRYVYVNSLGTSSTGGSVSAFSIAPVSGALTPISGSPYVTGVAAAAFAMDPAGRLLYVANRGTGNAGSISMFRVDSNTGALIVLSSPLNLQPAPTSVSVDPSGKFVYASSIASNQLYSFSIDATTGALIPLARAAVTRTGDQPISIVAVSSKDRPTPAAFASKFAYVANFADNTISQYLVNADTGSLAEIGAAFPAGLGPRAIAADPNGTVLFGTTQTDNTIASFAINASAGTLSLSRPAVPTAAAPIAVAVDASGRFLFVANSQTNTISGYRIDRSTGALAATGSVANTIDPPVALAVDPTSRVLFFVTNSSVGSAAIDLATGTLTTGTPISVEAGASAVAVDPTGRFAYVAIGTNPGLIRAYAINPYPVPSLGNLASIGTVASGAAPRAIAIDPTGRFAYTADTGSNSISAFAINQITGALSPNGAVAAGAGPVALTVDYSGKFVYATNSTANTLSIYSINTATGTLTPVGGVPTGNTPVAVAIAGEIR